MFPLNRQVKNDLKFTLLTKFFLSFLLTGLMLVGLMIGAMQFFTFRNFGEYVDQSELDKLSGLAQDLAREYEAHGSWEFIRANHDVWIRIFMRNGLIKNDRRLPDGRPPEPLHMSPKRPANPLDTGPRISLFDTDQSVVMGRALTMDDQVTRPVMLGDKTIGYLGLQKLEKLPNPLDAYYLAQQKKLIYLVGGLFLILSVLISYLLAAGLLAPIKRLSRAVHRLGKRQFDTKVDTSRTDELGTLARDFNTMIDQLSDYEQKQKQWLSDISHELRTPVAVLIGEIDAIQDGIRKPDPEAIQSIQTEVLRLKRLIDDLHVLFVEEAKSPSYETQKLWIIETLEASIDRLAAGFVQSRITVSRKWDADALVIGDREGLIQVFSNIFKNTCRYTDSPGRLMICLNVESGQICLTFDDTPPGIAEDKLSQIFDRLFRADPSRSRKTGGSGIGLSICKAIIERHGGKIVARGSKLGGLQIEIRLPIAKGFNPSHEGEPYGQGTYPDRRG